MSERHCGVAPESILVSTFTEKAAAEYDVSIPTETYILRGVIDLVRGEGDTVELVCDLRYFCHFK